MKNLKFGRRRNINVKVPRLERCGNDQADGGDAKHQCKSELHKPKSLFHNISELGKISVQNDQIPVLYIFSN